MKRKLIITLLVVVLVAVTGFFSYFIAKNEIGRSGPREIFVPEDIDISAIKSDIEFARTIPEYEIKFTGLLAEDSVTNFETILAENQDYIENFYATGYRSDGEVVEENYTGIKLKYIFDDIYIKMTSKNVVVYATDLFAAHFSMEEIEGDDVYLVWKRNGEYLVPSGDGIMKIVVDGGPTSKWVRNPVLFDFIGEYSDLVSEEDDKIGSEIDFVTQQNFFTLSLGYIPDVKIADWTLEIQGLVDNPLELTYKQLTGMPQESVFATLETISNPPGGGSIGNAVWTGVTFDYIMELVQPQDDVQEVVFYCLDGYSTSITLEEASRDGVMLAYKMNGETLEPKHGFPVRLVVPEKYGMKWPKWLYDIRFVDYDYKGYWEMRGWSDYAGRDKPNDRYD